MSVSPERRAFARELFAPLGAVTARPMMGGLCLYSEGRIFAILDGGGEIYLKAKGGLAEALGAAGARRFTYQREGRTMSMGYWSLPEDSVDDPERACEWARRALEAAEGS